MKSLNLWDFQWWKFKATVSVMNKEVWLSDITVTSFTNF